MANKKFRLWHRLPFIKPSKCKKDSSNAWRVSKGLGVWAMKLGIAQYIMMAARTHLALHVFCVGNS
jgi:hypothetical protein